MGRRNSKVPYIMMAVLAVAIAALLIYIVPYRYQLNHTVSFKETDEPLNNPLTGYAPSADNEEECQDSQLVYIGVTWSMWEPSQGEYDTIQDDPRRADRTDHRACLQKQQHSFYGADPGSRGCTGRIADPVQWRVSRIGE